MVLKIFLFSCFVLGAVENEGWKGNFSPPLKAWTILLCESRLKSLSLAIKLCKCWPIIMTDFPSCILNPLLLVITSLSEKHDRYSFSTSLCVSVFSFHLSFILHIIYCVTLSWGLEEAPDNSSTADVLFWQDHSVAVPLKLPCLSVGMKCCSRSFLISCECWTENSFPSVAIALPDSAV